MGEQRTRRRDLRQEARLKGANKMVQLIYHHIIAITGDADYYHVTCAASIYGLAAIENLVIGKPDPITDEPQHDREGNELHVVFSTDEIDPQASCGKCLMPINPSQARYQGYDWGGNAE